MAVTLPPDDEFNQTLVANVHPPGWINPTPSGRYNLVVIGAGTAGLVSAAGAAGLSAKVALIEKHLMGGDCLNVGCVPSKALLRAARAAFDTRQARDVGVTSSQVSIDFPYVMERLRRLRARISPHDSAERFTKLGVDVFLGQAKFDSPNSLTVGEHRLEFKKAIIATGARASIPSIPGLANVRPLTNENLFELTTLPARLGVIGAGPIGVEMAQAFARLGSQVTLLQGDKRILPREEPVAAAIVERSLRADGMDVLLGAKVMEVSAHPGGKILSIMNDTGKRRDIEVDDILVAVGRSPNVEGLGLELAGVEYAPQGVNVNDFLRTTNPNILAAGDICSSFKFTHAADALARIAIRNALFLGRQRASQLIIPWCTYSDPELARVGLTPSEAKEKNIDVTTFEQSFTGVDRAILDGEEEGIVRIHVRRGTDEILGATIVARHAGDMIAEITSAMRARVGLGQIASVIHPYPTQAEAIKRCGDAFQRTRLTPFIASLFRKWLAFTR